MDCANTLLRVIRSHAGNSVLNVTCQWRGFQGLAFSFECKICVDYVNNWFKLMHHGASVSKCYC